MKWDIVITGYFTAYQVKSNKFYFTLPSAKDSYNEIQFSRFALFSLKLASIPTTSLWRHALQSTSSRQQQKVKCIALGGATRGEMWRRPRRTKLPVTVSVYLLGIEGVCPSHVADQGDQLGGDPALDWRRPPPEVGRGGVGLHLRLLEEALGGFTGVL